MKWVDWISTNGKEVYVKVGILPLFMLTQCTAQKKS